jgi:hypothetical protein
VSIACSIFANNLPLDSDTNSICAQKCAEERVTVFVYGTLKRGFGNYWLIEEMIRGGNEELIGLR